MIKKLQIKFVAINMAMVTIMLCVIFGLVYHFTRANLEAQSISMMQSIAANPFHLGAPDEYTSELRLPYFTVQLGPLGELVSTGGGYYDLSDRTFLRDLVDESLGSRKQIGILREHDLRFCRVSSPAGTVLVFSDMSSENNTLDNLLKNSICIGIVSFLLFLGISIFLSRWAVKPVEAAWRQQKQFVADASHELKTPLTVIMTNADMLQSGEYDAPAQRQFSKNILLMAQQMRCLVEEMLTLAKSDAEQKRVQMAPLDLSKLVREASLSFEGVFADKGMTLSAEIEDNISVRGNARALEQVVEILLDNAQKYSAPCSETVLRLAAMGQGKCRLCVSNHGEAISDEDLHQIFRRFYRIDKARSRDGGFGLGLSIAQSIVTQHGGRIRAESQAGVNTFIVELRKI